MSDGDNACFRNVERLLRIAVIDQKETLRFDYSIDERPGHRLRPLQGGREARLLKRETLQFARILNALATKLPAHNRLEQCGRSPDPEGTEGHQRQFARQDRGEPITLERA